MTIQRRRSYLPPWQRAEACARVLGCLWLATAMGCTGGSGVSDVGRPCEGSGDCPGSLVCMVDWPGGYCTEACETGFPCAEGVCAANLCTASCSSSGDCRSGYACLHVDATKGCAPVGEHFGGLGDGCTGPDDCRTDLYCDQPTENAAQCTKPCTGLLECGANAVCVEGYCMRTCARPSDCADDQWCLLTTEGRICVPEPMPSALGGPCASRDDCQEGLTCRTDVQDGYCTRTCSGAGDCPDGACHEGYCCATCLAPMDKVDFLFVIDDSHGMYDHQAMLVQASSQFFSALRDQAVDYRMGVVSTDVSLGGYSVSGCRNLAGVLQNEPRLPQCEAPEDPWITPENVANPESSFACIAMLGDSGCGFEQPLEAMHLAVSEAVNPGFIRPDAALAVVILTTEDDCSARVPELFDEDAVQYGDLTSFRCFEYGMTCQGTGPAFYNCDTTPMGDGGALHPLSRYVSQLEGLKGGLDDVYVLVVAGQSSPVLVLMDSDNQPSLSTVCTETSSDVEPGIRMSRFASDVGGELISACGSFAAETWSRLLKRVTGDGQCRSGYECQQTDAGRICLAEP